MPYPNAATDSAVGRLRAGFEALASKRTRVTGYDVNPLRGRVCAVVDELKASGDRPARVILAIKRLATDSGMAWHEVETFGRIVRWCADRYYGEATPHQKPGSLRQAD